MATLTMVYKLAKVAEEGWWVRHGFALLFKVVIGIKFKDGEEVITKNQVT